MAERVLWTGNGLKLSIGRQILFDGASLAIHDRERVGLVGRNGSGKSTLLKIIAGRQEPAEGDICPAGNLRVSYLPQDFELAEDQTVTENVRSGAAYLTGLLKKFESLPSHSAEHDALEHRLLQLDAWSLDNRIQALLEKLRLPDGASSCRHLSGGEKRRVALARAVIAAPDLLLLDEPTNHLDIATIGWIEEFLAGYRGACLFVTHDRCFLDRLATRIIELDHGQLFSSEGSYADFLADKAEREYAEDQLEAKRRKFLRSEVEWVRRSPKARLRRNLGRLKRFQELDGQSGIERTGDIELVIPAPARLGNKTVELKEISVSFGDRRLIERFSFEFQPGCKIGIVGPNGIGKSTLLKVITGALPPTSGRVEIAPTVAFNYVDQGKLVLDQEKTVYEEISEGVDSIQLGSEKISIWGYLKRFLFENERINTRIKYLSGGEKARLTLAKILKRGGNFLILDEPTNDLDLSSLRMLEEALIDFPGCLLLVSHDRYFLNRICDGIMTFENDTIVYTHGDYDYYLSRRQEQPAAAPGAPIVKPANSSAPPVKAPPTKLSYKEQRELDDMEPAIAAAEKKVEELEMLFSLPDFFARYGAQSTELQQQLAESRQRVETLYQRWEELETKREQLQAK
ncbi:ABC-F family ATP-binding cassette domain-containing protein [Victivallis sp. Marseille-Q1083]|uniref:ABC-F family ATP-binding cassette domain-containing protein n=1 Tax=Victivallis sp. Marseille-Q1083 TaxID=2717288 RepID=UPI00158AB9ED|nr:ABC-F family ATP-binding cassette domain-containing protein [Victivallis sp. Marseille-Q1083]